MVTILSNSCLTEFGTYNFSKITSDDADRFVNSGIISVIKDELTAQIISILLDMDCGVYTGKYSQAIGTTALIFTLNGTIKKDVVITKELIEKTGYSWALLERLW